MVREANANEVNAIIKFNANRMGLSAEEELIPSKIAVIPDYMSDGPGYAGPMYLVVWGEPQYVDVFTLVNATTCEHCGQDRPLSDRLHLELSGSDIEMQTSMVPEPDHDIEKDDGPTSSFLKENV